MYFIFQWKKNPQRLIIIVKGSVQKYEHLYKIMELKEKM